MMTSEIANELNEELGFTKPDPSLEVEIATLKAERDEAREEAAARKHAIEYARLRVDSLKARIAELEAANDDLRARIGLGEDQNAALDKRIAELEAGLREADARGYARGIEEAAGECERGCGQEPRLWRIDELMRGKATSIRSLLAPEKQP